MGVSCGRGGEGAGVKDCGSVRFECAMSLDAACSIGKIALLAANCSGPGAPPCNRFHLQRQTGYSGAFSLTVVILAVIDRIEFMMFKLTKWF
tara:strand:- start:1430 stop:1705 length:276 start_codon:yes stop_codon:yes gene_type:complete